MEAQNCLRQICYRTATRQINVAWLSFQDDGSISFGLNDRAFISPKFKGQYFVWNAYNRVKTTFLIASDPTTLEPVKNPHFTFHPAAMFHLKGNEPSAEALFEGIADVGITVEQKGQMPWLRVFSSPLHRLPRSAPRHGKKPDEHLVISVPDELLSAGIALDFVKHRSASERANESTWYLPWHNVTVRLTLSFTHPTVATLSWFHFH